VAYTKTNWLDRIVQFANRYTKSGETSTEVTLVQSPGTVTQAGTAVNAAALNKMEKGIEDAHITADAALPKAGGIMSGSIINTNDQPLKVKVAGRRSVLTHVSAAGDFYICPSNSIDAEDWDFVKGLRINLVAGDAYILGSKVWTRADLRDNGGVLEIFTSGAWKPVGGIKRILRGTTAVTNNASGNTTITVDVPISAVDVNKSEERLRGSYSHAGSSGTSHLVSVELTSSTNLRISWQTGSWSATIQVPWEVVESY